MYKVMTKLHTMKENVYAFHMIAGEDGKPVEYEAETPQEAAEMAISLLGRVGYEDLRIVDDKSYYIDLIYGKRPKPVPDLYTIHYINIRDYEPDQEYIENIVEGSTVQSVIRFLEPEIVSSFHLIIDGIEYPDGNPEWVEFSEVVDGTVIITYKNVTDNHDIEVWIDEM